MRFGAFLERPSSEILEIRLKPQEPFLGLLELQGQILLRSRLALRGACLGLFGGRLSLLDALRLLPRLDLIHRRGGLAKRLLELRARRERPLRVFLGQGLPILGLLGPLDLDLLALLPRAHGRSFPVISSEK